MPNSKLFNILATKRKSFGPNQKHLNFVTNGFGFLNEWIAGSKDYAFPEFSIQFFSELNGVDTPKDLQFSKRLKDLEQLYRDYRGKYNRILENYSVRNEKTYDSFTEKTLDLDMSHQIVRQDLFCLVELRLDLHRLLYTSDNSTPDFDEVEEWFDNADFRVILTDKGRVKKPILPAQPERLDFWFSYQVCSELLEFLIKHPLGDLGTCKSCQGKFLWNRKDQEFCSDICKLRKFRNK